MMVKAKNLEGLTDELKSLLNTEYYEENFGEILRNNIKTVIKARKLHLFVRYSKEIRLVNQAKDEAGLIEEKTIIGKIV